MTQIHSRRCKKCNWLNKEVSETFVCKNCKKSNVDTTVTEEVKEVEAITENETSNDWLKEIDKIKGIGEETLSDIERIYPSEDALVGALKDDTCPFRNDVVQKLKSKLIK